MNIFHYQIVSEAQYWKTLDKGKKHLIGVIANLPDDQTVISGEGVHSFTRSLFGMGSETLR